MINFTNISGSNEIGANCYLLDIDGVRVTLDSGMHPKKEGMAAVPDFSCLEKCLEGKGALDAIFVTHAHLDHLGTLPVMQTKHPTAEVYMTHATAALADAMLHNSVNVMMTKRTELGIADYPLFMHRDLDYLEECWKTCGYGEQFRIGVKKDVLVTLYDAGHIMGSAGVYLESKQGKSIFYTGDVQLENQTLIPGADFPLSGVDTLIMECTRGGVERCVHYKREEELLRLANKINEILKGGGAVMIPVFAIGKSQELLYNLDKFRQQGLIPRKTPIYFGGLSAKVTRLFDKFAQSIPRFHADINLSSDIFTQGVPKKGKGELRAEPGNIYLISSGMMTENTLSNKLAEQILPRKRDAILFVGYCDPDSPAGALRMTPHGDSIKMRSNGRKFQRLCTVESYDFSGHTPRELLVEYAVSLAPKRVVLVHGDPDALEWMRMTLATVLPDADVIVPEPGVTYTLQ